MFKEFKTKSEIGLKVFQSKHKYKTTSADLLQQMKYVSIEYNFGSPPNLEM